MSRVNAFLEAGNDAGRRVSVGGRASSNSVWAWLNTDNATGTTAIRVSAEVVGHGLTSRDRKLKSIGDHRKSIFIVELPDQVDGNCEVRIEFAGHKLRELVGIGAMLCGIKGAEQIAAGEVSQGIKTIRQARKFIEEIDADGAEIPNVTLPGGVTLKHALACVKVVEDLIGGSAKQN